MGMGGGVNLGSASIFLFVDATQARTQLRQYERDVQNFQKKMEATARAITRSSAANAAADNATAAARQLSTPPMVAAEKATATAVANSQRVIAAAYAERTRLLRATAAAEKASAEVIKKAEADKQAAIKMTQKQQALENKLGVGSWSPFDPRVLTAGSMGFKKAAAELQELRRTYGDVAAQQRIIAASTAKITAEQNKLKAAAAATSAAFTKSYATQNRAVGTVKSMVTAQANEYRKLAATGGPVFNKLATDIERAADRFVAANTRMIDAQAKLKRATQERSAAERTGVGVAAARRAEEAAATAAAKAVAAQQRAYKSLNMTQASVSKTAQTEAAKRVAIAEREAEAVKRALREQEDARRQQDNNAIDNMVGAAEGAVVGLAGGIAAVTREAVSFEEQMYNVASISQEVADNLPRFTQNVQDLALELGKSPQELAAGLYEITQAGFEGEEAFALLELSAQAAVAGLTSVEAAAKPLITTVLAYGYSIEEASSALDVLFAGVTEGIYSFEELSQQLGDNLSLASTLGVPIEELSAAYVVLTKRSNSLAESTTQVNAIMNSFLKPSEALSNAVKEYTGQTAQAYFRTHSLAEVLELSNRMFKDNADAAGALFPNIRAIRGEMGLTSGEVAEFNKQMGIMNDAEGTTGRVLAKQMESAAFSFRKAREQFRQAAIVLGNELIPHLLNVANIAASVASWFSNLDESVRQAVGGFLFFSTVGLGVVALLNKMRIAALTLGRGMVGLAGRLALVPGILTRAAVAMATFGRGAVAVMATINPMVLALGAIAVAAVAIYATYKRIEKENADLAESYRALAEAASKATSAQQADRVLGLQIETGDSKSYADNLAAQFVEAYDKRFARLNREGLLIDGPAFLDIDNPFLDYGIIQDMNEYVLAGTEVAEINTLMASNFEIVGDYADEYLRITEDLFIAHNSLAFSGDNLLNVQRGINAAFSEAQNADEVAAVIDHITAALARYNEEKVRNPELAADNLGASISFLGTEEGRKYIVQQGKLIGELAQANEEAASTFEEVAQAAGQSKQDVLDALASIIEKAKIASNALLDLSDPLAFLRQQFANPDLGLLEALENIDRLSQQRGSGIEDGFGLGDEDIQIIKVANALEYWTRTLGRATDALGEHNNAYGRYQQLSQDVSDLLGVEGDEYAYLDRLLENNRISQSEYNTIKQAAIDLQATSILGMEDEREAMVRAIPDLAAYIEAYRESAGAYEELSPEQKGRIAALEDERNQTILLTIVMLKLLEAMGQIDAGDTVRFASEIAAANPAVGALLTDMGLLKKAADITVVIDTASAKQRLDEIATRSGELRDIISNTLTEAARQGVTGEDAAALVKPYRQELDALTDEDREIRVSLETDRSVDAGERQLAAGIVADEEAIAAGVAEREQAEKDAAAAVEETADEVEILTVYYSDLAKIAENSGNTLRDALNGILADAAQATGALYDLSDPLAFIRQQMGDPDKSLFEVLVEMAKIDPSLGFADDGTDAAVEAAANLDFYTRKLTEATDALDAHAATMGEYESLSQQVTDLLGIEGNEYGYLDAMLRRGAISQDEYNTIKQAAISIQDTATVGIEEERAAMARSLPEVARYIEAFRLSRGEYEALSPEQKARIEILKDERNQTVLLTAVMLKLLEAMGAVGNGFADRVLKDLAKGSPAVAAMLESYGLIEETLKPITVEVEATAALDRLEEVRTRADEVREEIESVQFKLETRQIDKKEAERQLGPLQRELAALTGEEREIILTLAASDFASPEIHAAAEAIRADAEAMQVDLEETGDVGMVMFADMSEAARNFGNDVRDAMVGFARDAAIATGAVYDLSDPLAFIRQQLGNPDLTLLEAIQVMSKMNINLGLEDDVQDAINVASALDYYTRKLTDANTVMSEHNNRVSEYRQISDDVTALLGVEGDELAYLNSMLQMGLLTQDEYNAIKDAATQIQDTAIVGMEQERVAVAKLLPDYARYLEAVRRTTASYEDLTPEQKGRIAALEDERNQTALMVVMMAKLLEVVGAVERGFSDRLATEIAGTSDALSGLFRDYGLIADQPPISVEIDTVASMSRLAEVQSEIATVREQIKEATKVAFSNPANADEVLGPFERRLAALTDEERTIILELDAAGSVDPEIKRQAAEIRARDKAVNDGIEARAAAQEAAQQADEDARQAAEEAARAADELRARWEAAWASIDPSNDTLREMADQTIPDLISSITPGLDDPFGYLFKGVPEAQRSVETLILRAEELTGTALDLEPWARQALLVSQAFARTADALEDVTSEIEQSTTAIGTYEGYISLVDDTLGDSTNTLDRYHKQLATGKIRTKEYNEAVASGEAHIAYAELNKLLDKGLITQDEYNEILAAGESIRRSSNRAILEEQAAVALSLPALDEYIKRHRLAEQNYRNLTDEQRGFIAALEDENTQAALSNVLMIMSLEQVGAVAEGTAGRVVDAYSKVSPAFAALAEDIGLIEGARGVEVAATVKAETSAQEAVDASGTAEIPATITPTVDAAGAAVEGDKAARSFAGAFISGVSSALAASGTTISAQFNGGAAGSAIASKYVEAIIAGLESATSLDALATAVSGVLSRVQGVREAGETVGLAFIEGVANGAAVGEEAVRAAGVGVGRTLVRGGMDAIDANSPSKEGEYLGEMFVEGVVKGVEATTPGVATVGGALGDELGAAFDAVLAAGAPLWLEDLARSVASLGEGIEAVDPEMLRTLADEMLAFDGATAAMRASAQTLNDLADVAEANLATISSSGRDFASNLTWASDQIKAYMGDDTPAWLVDMALEIDALAESSNQLDAERIKQYAAALRSTGDSSLAATANYLDVVASNIEERARRAKLQAAADAAAAAREIAEEAGPTVTLGAIEVEADALDELRDLIERRTKELPDILKKYSKLPPETVAQAGAYLENAIAGNVDGMIAEYDRLAQTLDRRTLDIIAATGQELAKSGVPRGWVLGPNYEVVRDMSLLHDLAVRYLGSEAAAAEFLARANILLSDSFDTASDAARSYNDQINGTANQTSAVARGTMSFYPILSEQFGSGFAALTEDQQSAMVRFLRAFVTGNRDAASDAWGDVSSFMTTAGQQALIALGWSLRGQGEAAGASLAQGMSDGVAASTEEATTAAGWMANAVVNTVHKTLGIASPSRVMAAAGTNAALSFADAFLAASQRAVTRSRDAARAQITAYTDEIQRGVNQLSGGLARPSDLLGAQGLIARRGGGGPQTRVVTVNAPVTLGTITVQGSGDPAAVASEVRDRVWGELVDGIERIWAQVEGAV